MKRKSAAQVFREASPELTVIPGGTYRHTRRKKAIKLAEISTIEFPIYTPHCSSEKDWNVAGGVVCPVCRREVVRLMDYGAWKKRKACQDCIQRRERLLEYKRRLFAFRRRAEMGRRRRLLHLPGLP